MTNDDPEDEAEMATSPAARRPDERSGASSDPDSTQSEWEVLQRLIAHSPHAMAATEGASHVLRSVNAAFCRLMNVAAEEVLGRGYADAFPEPSGMGPHGLLDRAFHAGETVMDEEVARARASAEPAVWSYTVWPREGRAGERPGVIIEVRDRTRAAESRRHLEEMAEQIRQINERLLRSALEEQDWAEKADAANRAKSDFLAMMSHELRTPLTGIVGFTDVLMTEVQGPINEQQRESLARIRTCSSHLLELIEDVLNYARMEAHADLVVAEPVDLCALAQEAAALIEPVALRKGLKLRISLPPSPVAAETDRKKVRQILLNLLSNAIKFTDVGEVCLEVRAENGRIHFFVTDTGIGIDTHDLDRVFEPFVQAEAITTRRFGGTGLGLPISRALALMLGGNVSVESVPGQGSTFAVHLPATAARSSRTPGPAGPEPGVLTPA